MTTRDVDFADLADLSLTDSETLLVHLHPDTTPAQAADMHAHLAHFDFGDGRVLILPPQCEIETECVGRVVITWRADQSQGLRPWMFAIHDADTGAMLTTVTGLRLIADAAAGPAAHVIAELRQFVDENGVRVEGAPDGHNRAHLGDGTMRTGLFRYLVAEMRLPDGFDPTRSINAQRADHGLPPLAFLGAPAAPTGSFDPDVTYRSPDGRHTFRCGRGTPVELSAAVWRALEAAGCDPASWIAAPAALDEPPDGTP